MEEGGGDGGGGGYARDARCCWPFVVTEDNRRGHMAGEKTARKEKIKRHGGTEARKHTVTSTHLDFCSTLPPENHPTSLLIALVSSFCRPFTACYPTSSTYIVND